MKTLMTLAACLGALAFSAGAVAQSATPQGVTNPSGQGAQGTLVAASTPGTDDSTTLGGGADNGAGAGSAGGLTTGQKVGIGILVVGAIGAAAAAGGGGGGGGSSATSHH